MIQVHNVWSKTGSANAKCAQAGVAFANPGCYCQDIIR